MVRIGPDTVNISRMGLALIATATVRILYAYYINVSPGVLILWLHVITAY